MLWDMNNLAKPVKVLKGHGEGIWNVNYTSDGTKLATASPEGIAKIWDVKAGKSV
jgi:WD40 repeat protein